MAQARRDHGGDLDRAMQTYGEGQWIDLSTGINPVAYPLPNLDARSWSALPTRSNVAALEAAAAVAYETNSAAVSMAGAQAAIQLLPRLTKPGRACVVGPTYNEHAAALETQGWTVEVVSEPEEGAGADLLTVVNPNNPDGRRWSADRLLGIRDKVGLLVVDESFADTAPKASMAPMIGANEDRVVLLRSFGKFYGLAGLRLGFALTGQTLAEALRALVGPWAVSGPAIAIGRDALANTQWQTETRARLARDAERLDALAAGKGWRLVGGTDLFRTYETGDAIKSQSDLAQARIWTRIFPYSETWIRMGLPGCDKDWARLEDVLSTS